MTLATFPAVGPLDQAREHLRRYLQAFPAEAASLCHLSEQLDIDTGSIFARHNMRGHITTSALVYQARTDAVLMIHHQVLGRWLQPGGHHEGQDELVASAAREVAEETGVTDLSAWRWLGGQDLPLDIETHAIPANPAKAEGDHAHHDFIYLFSVENCGEIRPQWTEVRDARWMPRAEFTLLPEARFARLGRKLSALLAVHSG